MTALLVGLVLVAAFVAWELRTDAPMLPMRLQRRRSRSRTPLRCSCTSACSARLLAQFFQTVQGYSPLGSGLRFLPWTLAPMFIAPLAGALSDKIPAKNMIGVGLAMQAAALAWMASVSTPTTPYSQLIGPFIVAGVGMALFFAPVANLVLGGAPEEEGKSSGANNAIRELGGVFGVAVLASIFAHVGGYGTARASLDGMNPALFVGAGVVAPRSARRVHDPARASRGRGARGEPELAYEADAPIGLHMQPERPRKGPFAVPRSGPLIARSSRSSWPRATAWACVRSPR